MNQSPLLRSPGQAGNRAVVPVTFLLLAVVWLAPAARVKIYVLTGQPNSLGNSNGDGKG